MNLWEVVSGKKLDSSPGFVISLVGSQIQFSIRFAYFRISSILIFKICQKLLFHGSVRDEKKDFEGTGNLFMHFRCEMNDLRTGMLFALSLRTLGINYCILQVQSQTNFRGSTKTLTHTLHSLLSNKQPINTTKTIALTKITRLKSNNSTP